MQAGGVEERAAELGAIHEAALADAVAVFEELGEFGIKPGAIGIWGLASRGHESAPALVNGRAVRMPQAPTDLPKG